LNTAQHFDYPITKLPNYTITKSAIAAPERFVITIIPVNPLNVFGLLAVTAMMVCWYLEERSPWFILAFAASCGLASAYGFLQGAWPFGLVECVWSAIAVHHWWVTVKKNQG